MLAALRTDRYRQAAVWYFFYGVVYLVGAVVALTPSRMVTFWGFIPWWAFYVAGALMVVVLPVLVWQRHKWITRILCLGPAGKALSLCWRQGRLLSGSVVAADAATEAANRASFIYNWFFLAVAMIAAVMLLRAGWGPQRERQPAA